MKTHGQKKRMLVAVLLVSVLGFGFATDPDILLMDDPEVLLYRWQGPRVAHTELESNKRDWAFMVDEHHKYLGICTHDMVAGLIKRQEKQIASKQLDRPEPVAPDMLIEDLFGLVSAESYPLPVTDEKGKLLGVIRPRAILEVLHNSEPESDDV